MLSRESNPLNKKINSCILTGPIHKCFVIKKFISSVLYIPYLLQNITHFDLNSVSIMSIIHKYGDTSQKSSLYWKVKQVDSKVQ